MRRKLIAFILSLTLLLCLTFSVSATEYSRIVDETGLLQPEEITYLEELSDKIYDSYGIDAVVLAVNSLMGNSAQNYADTFYDSIGYSENGIVFLLAMQEREWYISTSGSMIYALTDYGIQQVGEQVVSYFSDGLWFDGFCQFFFVLPEYIDAYHQGRPIDGYADYSGNYYHGDQDDVVYYEEEFTPSFPLSLFIGIVTAGIVILVMRASMNTKRSQRGAGVYMNKDSWKVTQHRDVFLYSNVTKTRRQETNSGGGSSVHRTSGGRSHGGGGGKF